MQHLAMKNMHFFSTSLFLIISFTVLAHHSNLKYLASILQSLKHSVMLLEVLKYRQILIEWFTYNKNHLFLHTTFSVFGANFLNSFIKFTVLCINKNISIMNEFHSQLLSLGELSCFPEWLICMKGLCFSMRNQTVFILVLAASFHAGYTHYMCGAERAYIAFSSFLQFSVPSQPCLPGQFGYLPKDRGVVLLLSFVFCYSQNPQKIPARSREIAFLKESTKGGLAWEVLSGCYVQLSICRLESIEQSHCLMWIQLQLGYNLAKDLTLEQCLPVGSVLNLNGKFLL